MKDRPMLIAATFSVAGLVTYIFTEMKVALILLIVASIQVVPASWIAPVRWGLLIGFLSAVALSLPILSVPNDTAFSWAVFFAVAAAISVIGSPNRSTTSSKTGSADNREGPGSNRIDLDFIHPDDRDAITQAEGRALWSGFPQVVKYRHIQPDGSFIWTDFRAEPTYRIADTIAPKISAQHLPWTVADSLGETADAARMAMILETIFGGGWALDPTGRFTYATPNAQTTVGLTLEQMNEPLDGKLFVDGGNLGWKRMFHPDEYERVATWFRHCLKTGQNWNDEYRLRRASTGEYGWYRVAARPTRDSHNRITGWYGTSIDITVLKQTEEALRSRERELSQLVDMVPIHIIRLNADGKPTFISKGTADFFALENQLLEEPEKVMAVMREALHPDDAAKVTAMLKRASREGERFALTYRVRRGDGMYRWMNGRGEPLRDEAGKIVQWYAVSLDIDDQVRTQEELRLAQENLARASQAASLAELSASIAHEVGQPLAALLSSAEASQRWLLNNPPNIDRAQQALERVVRGGNSAAEIINRIRALFKHSTSSREPIYLQSIVAEARDLMAEECSQHGVQLEVNIDDDLPAIILDRVQIQQVLINLLRNGVDAMKKSNDAKLLRVWISLKQDVIEIGVSDTGHGVEVPTLIFEPFFTTKEQGMGMGLAICRSIVERHGGRLWTEKNLPKGATFLFTLPLDSEGHQLDPTLS